MSIVQLEIPEITNPEDQQKLLNLLKTCSDAKFRIAAERDYIKEAVQKISKELQVPKKILNEMIKTYHDDSFDQKVAVHEQFEHLYETVVKVD